MTQSITTKNILDIKIAHFNTIKNNNRLNIVSMLKLIKG